ncbi:MAG: phosphoglycerate dehydrogenase, partial [Candidatus Omnitrophica bacterium]|nr:phosphoglycerate dehydrogenase [Candidatus Omnitrophota bacterium]
TAEHAFALMMSLSRNIPNANQSIKSGLWDRKGFMGAELYRKVLGIIGLGRIGEAFAKRAQSFEMEVIAYDPFLSEEKAKSINVEHVTFKSLLQRSDFITIHTPLTEDTKNLIDEEAFKLMKKDVRIINAARGGIIDEKALAKYIRSGKVKGAALDVYSSKLKPPMDSPVIAMNEVITTPHLGSATSEAQIKVSVDIAECVADALNNKSYRNAVNVPILDDEMMARTSPYIDLAERLGSVATQLMDEPISSIKVKYTGELANLDTSVLTRSLVKGLFTLILDEHVNYVNSMVVAKDRGIKVEEKKTSEITDFANLITVEIASGKKKRLIMGTLFKNNDPRIVRIDDFYLEAVPEGFMLVITNKDVPGIVGK